MIRLLRRQGRRRADLAVTFCESCGSVCTPACRADAQRERSLTDIWTYTPQPFNR